MREVGLIACVPQGALLFHRSIHENIAYGRPDATDGEIREEARLANALEFVDWLPAGLDTMVGERDVKLFGGQRQRVAIARAILADCPILVLDEATSALDSESEALVQGVLENLMHSPTSIVVAHRLSTVGCPRPHHGAGRRSDRRGRHARRAQACWRRPREPLGPPDRRVPGGGVRSANRRFL